MSALLFCVSTYAQDKTTTNFYYGSNGQKIYLTETNSSLVQMRSGKKEIHKNKDKNQMQSELGSTPEFIQPGYKSASGATLYPTNKIIFKLKKDVSLQELRSVLNKYNAKNERLQNGYYLIELPSDLVFEASNEIYETNKVEYSHPDIQAEIVLNNTTDPLYAEQFQLHNTGQEIDGFQGVVDIDINAPEAWSYTKGSDVIVAVMDDGVESHPDLQDNNGNTRVLQGYNATGEGNGRPNDNGNHGQSCAGIIAASHNNRDIAGIAPNVKILPINIFTSGTTASDIAAAYYYAINQGAGIISNSWGYRSSDFDFPVLNDAINAASKDGRNGKGALVVFASGNDSRGTVGYPSNLESVISVGAVNHQGKRSFYSNYGPKLDVVAPSGGDKKETAQVRTLDRFGDFGYDSGATTNTFSGTSAACPVVSGVLALALSEHPELTAQELTDALYATTKDLGEADRDDEYGHGLIKADALLNHLGQNIPSCNDGIQNGDEEGIDCGGTNCEPCQIATCVLPTEVKVVYDYGDASSIKLYLLNGVSESFSARLKKESDNSYGPSIEFTDRELVLNNLDSCSNYIVQISLSCNKVYEYRFETAGCNVVCGENLDNINFYGNNEYGLPSHYTFGKNGNFSFVFASLLDIPVSGKYLAFKDRILLEGDEHALEAVFQTNILRINESEGSCSLTDDLFNIEYTLEENKKPFGPQDAFVNENESIVNVTFTVLEAYTAEEAQTFTYVTRDGSAKSSEDYEKITEGAKSITFEKGEIEKTIAIPIIKDDQEVEGDEEFFIEMIYGYHPVFGFPYFMQGKVTIIDNDTPTVTYCDMKGNNSNDDNITNVTFAGINKASSDTTTGYHDYTDNVANVSKGTSENMTVTFHGWSGGNDNEVYVWIDWNQDGDFTDAGEKFEGTGTGTSRSVTIAIPNTASNGNTRMRVVLGYNTNDGDNACTNIQYGEVEDYTISIEDGVAPSCTDGIQNGDETGVDCGGSSCAPCAGDGTVVYVDNTDIITNASRTWNPFRIEVGDNNSFGPWYSGGTLRLATYEKDVVCEGTTNNITFLAEGVEVGAASNFVANSNSFVVSSTEHTSWNGKSGYIGFTFTINGATHYGWFYATVSNDGSSYVIEDYAYNTTADQGLLTKRPNEIATKQINASETSSKISVYPNPFKESFIVDVSQLRREQITVMVYDMLGEQVFSKKYNKGTINIVIDEGITMLGAYFVKVYTQTHSETLQIIKH
ncbi:S8 family serine peptidase [Aquimarina sp. 2201CG5-10]|uniref:S8 family serine peptidase n=1 Tax=Aquimarina callyspongiae TaxID=3098150 RepID=UPI002AB47880|nr:S8 family serine peptidase [Aquimarina sp. 2201CG5-10]MDY8137854.1 S8 family serine peptidase [Aquimarina sp. 2201CG5-10]